MDRALYVGMSGAKQNQRAQAVNANNLANISTNGFRAQLLEAQSQPVKGGGFATRVNTQSADTGWDASVGSIIQTGNNLDVALRQGSWLAVQASDGTEAYTRGGDLKLDVNGQLLTAGGQPVLSDAGPLSLPPSSSVHIANDGTITVIPLGQSANAPVTVGRLKVTDAVPSQLARGTDGLMRTISGQPLEAASGSVLNSGAVESSNVNVANVMVNMISLSRQYDMQTRLMKSVDENASAASSLVKDSN